MLVTMKEMLEDARKNHYAIPAFDVSNYEMMKAVLETCEEEKSPALLMGLGVDLQGKNMSLLTSMIKASSEFFNVPVCFHLDHATDFSFIKEAIDAGFSSVMYDGSALPYEQNLANTKKVCEVAHACGVSVEAELGSIAAGDKSHEGSADDKEVYTDPKLAKEFVEITKVDALAVSVGTVHGLYKGKPNIRFDILEEINKEVGIPLVMHGGSGIPEEDILKSIANGISKINVNTEIATYAVEQTAKYLQEKQPHFSVLSLKQEEFVKDIVKKYIAFFGM